MLVDLFGGSGSTLIGCERRGRKARLMEIDPRYADCIIRRWQDYTGQQATLDGDGRTLERVKAEQAGLTVCSVGELRPRGELGIRTDEEPTAQ